MPFELGTFDVHLFSPLDLIPFATPESASIWDKESASIGKEAYDEERERLMSSPNLYFVECFLAIANFKDGAAKIEGISGYFPIDAVCERFFLRWHGVAEEFKKQGLSQLMVETACHRICSIHPDAKCLVEHMPAISAFDPVAESFSKMGVSPLDDLHLHEWSHTLGGNGKKPFCLLRRLKRSLSNPMLSINSCEQAIPPQGKTHLCGQKLFAK